MTKLQEIMNLTMLEENIIQFGKIEREKESEPFECAFDRKRLENFRFFRLQDKYSYGWYIAEETLEQQIKSLERFKLYIMDHYKEKNR